MSILDNLKDKLGEEEKSRSKPLRKPTRKPGSGRKEEDRPGKSGRGLKSSGRKRRPPKNNPDSRRNNPKGFDEKQGLGPSNPSKRGGSLGKAGNPSGKKPRRNGGKGFEGTGSKNTLHSSKKGVPPLGKKSKKSSNKSGLGGIGSGPQKEVKNSRSSEKSVKRGLEPSNGEKGFKKSSMKKDDLGRNSKDNSGLKKNKGWEKSRGSVDGETGEKARQKGSSSLDVEKISETVKVLEDRIETLLDQNEEMIDVLYDIRDRL